MTNINDITDLVQILQDHPEWRNTLRGLIIGEELATIPARVQNLERILAQFMTATNENFKLVYARLDGIDGRLDGIDGRLDGIDGRLDGIDGRLDGIDGRLDGIDGRIDGIDSSIGELRSEINQTNERMNQGFAQVNGRMDNGFGNNYEVKVARNIASIARQQLQIRRPRVLASSTTGTVQEWLDFLEDAQDQDSITSRQVDEVLAADIVLNGHRQDTGTDTYVIIEVSITLGDDDISRAHDRATIIRDSTRRPVLAAVICVHADPDRTRFAQELGVLTATVPA